MRTPQILGVWVRERGLPNYMYECTNWTKNVHMAQKKYSQRNILVSQIWMSTNLGMSLLGLRNPVWDKSFDVQFHSKFFITTIIAMRKFVKGTKWKGNRHIVNGGWWIVGHTTIQQVGLEKDYYFGNSVFQRTGFKVSVSLMVQKSMQFTKMLNMFTL